MDDKQNSSRVTLADVVVEEGDVAIILRDRGMVGAAWVRLDGRLHKMPFKVKVSYAKAPAPPQTVRHVAITAGWREADFNWEDVPSPSMMSSGSASSLRGDQRRAVRPH